MLTQVPESRQNEEQPQLPFLSNTMSISRIEGLTCPYLFSEPMCDTELDAVVLAQCFSLARCRARELRQSELEIVAFGAESESGRAAASECFEPGRGE